MIVKSRTETIEFIEIDSNIDLGNFNLKAVGFDENEEMVMVTLPNLIETRNTLNHLAKMIEINNRKLFIGCGNANNKVLKHKRDFLLEQVLTMTCMLYPKLDNMKINLKLGLPPAEFSKSAYQKALLENFKIGHIYNFKLEGKEKNIIINSAKICIEGYSAFVAIADEVKYSGRDLLVIDVGGGTTDACPFSYNFDLEQFIPGMPITIESGNINLVSDITNKIKNKDGADISTLQIDTYIRKDINRVEFGDFVYDIIEYIPSAKATASLIFSRLENEYGSLDKYELVLVGGGAKLFNALMDDKINKKIELDENFKLYANALGFALQ